MVTVPLSRRGSQSRSRCFISYTVEVCYVAHTRCTLRQKMPKDTATAVARCQRTRRRWSGRGGVFLVRKRCAVIVAADESARSVPSAEERPIDSAGQQLPAHLLVQAARHLVALEYAVAHLERAASLREERVFASREGTSRGADEGRFADQRHTNRRFANRAAEELERGVAHEHCARGARPLRREARAVLEAPLAAEHDDRLLVEMAD
mmetsp:Transcript_53085/g.121914  ORF Transcript_53085/g.121914 Transcript_53085/m.121914 type:complete len:208 (+) Transcript_53085:356-979(+)